MNPLSPKEQSSAIKAAEERFTLSATRIISRALAPVMKQIKEALKAGDTITAKDLLSGVDLTPVLPKLEKRAQTFTRATALIGTGAIDDPGKSAWGQGAPFPPEVDVHAVRLLLLGLRQSFKKTILKKLEKMIDDAAKEDAARAGMESLEKSGAVSVHLAKLGPYTTKELGDQINKVLRGESKRVLDTGANIVGTRVAAFGMMHEALVRGISRYRIDAVLDERTTEICRHMDGKTFEVRGNYHKTRSILQVGDPARAAKIAPFPDPADVIGKDEAALAAAGITVPPFHFHCRSVLTLVDTTTEYLDSGISKFPSKPENPPYTELAAYVEPDSNIYTNAFPELDSDAFAGLTTAVLKGETPDGHKAIYEELAHVHAYTGHTYHDVNGALRHSAPSADVLTLDEVRKAVKHVDNYVKRFTVSEDIIVYRSMGSKASTELEIGKVFQDNAFVSTSRLATEAETFALDEKVLLEILVPKGSHAAPTAIISQFPNEVELLLPRSAQFRVVDIQKDVPVGSDGNKFTIIKLVFQGVGELTDLDTFTPPTNPVSVVKAYGATAPTNRADRYTWRLGDTTECTFD